MARYADGERSSWSLKRLFLDHHAVHKYARSGAPLRQDPDVDLGAGRLGSAEYLAHSGFIKHRYPDIAITGPLRHFVINPHSLALCRRGRAGFVDHEGQGV